MKKTLFFDAGNTLINIFAMPKKELFGYFCENLGGLDLTNCKVEEGAKASEIFYQRSCFIPGYLNTLSFWEKYYFIGLNNAGISENRSKELAVQISKISSRVKQNYRLVEGCLNTLQQLWNNGHEMAIISNWDGTLVKVLEDLGISRYFKYVADSALLGVEKPNREIFDIALSRMGCDANNAIYIGDLYFYDVMPAQSIGMEAILYDSVGVLDAEFNCNKITELSELHNFIG